MRKFQYHSVLLSFSARQRLLGEGVSSIELILTLILATGLGMIKENRSTFQTSFSTVCMSKKILPEVTALDFFSHRKMCKTKFQILDQMCQLKYNQIRDLYKKAAHHVLYFHHLLGLQANRISLYIWQYTFQTIYYIASADT